MKINWNPLCEHVLTKCLLQLSFCTHEEILLMQPEKTADKNQQSMKSIYDISKFQVWIFCNTNMYNCVIDVL